MERYDAILEQLEKAQGRGMETITNRLDFVVQSLEELIQEAKSSIQEALPESANECLPVDDVKAALDAFRDEAAAERRRSAELETRVAEFEHMAESSQHGASIELLRALDGAASQSELLKELLPAISEHAARAVVLVLRDGKVTAWSGIGFTDGEALRSWQGNAVESPALTKLLEVCRPVRFAPTEDDLFQDWLGDETQPVEVILIPVVLRGKLMGTVYIDRLGGQPWQPETAQTLVAQVCWLIDTLQYRQVAAASLAEPVAIGQPVKPTEPELEVEDEEEPAIDETEAVDETPDEPEENYDPEQSEVDPSATMKIDVSEMGYGDTPSEEVVVDEGFEAIEPADVEPEPEIVSEGFEPDAPAPPEFDAAPEAEFEPEPDTSSRTSPRRCRPRRKPRPHPSNRPRFQPPSRRRSRRSRGKNPRPLGFSMSRRRCNRCNHHPTSPRKRSQKTRHSGRRRAGSPDCSCRRSNSTTRNRSNAAARRRTSTSGCRKTSTAAARCSKNGSRPKFARIRTIFRTSWFGFLLTAIPKHWACRQGFAKPETPPHANPDSDGLDHLHRCVR